jgi:3-oxoacyl-[acyl-carrier protein] reductase
VIREAGGEAIAVEADMTEKAQALALVEEAVEEYGRLDVMVNNAGVARVNPLLKQTEEDWKSVLDVNLTGVFFGLQAAGEQMIEQGDGGQIINISSLFGDIGVQECAPYNTSKAAVNNLTRCAAVEFAEHDIHVNAMAPGFISTGQTETDKTTRAGEKAYVDWPHYGETDEQIFERTPLGRYGTGEEVANCAVFLARGDHYMTGHVLLQDGGWSAFGWGSKGR